VQTETIVTY